MERNCGDDEGEGEKEGEYLDYIYKVSTLGSYDGSNFLDQNCGGFSVAGG